MNTRKMGVVLLLLMFVVIAAALSGYSNNPHKQDSVTVSDAVSVVSSAISLDSTGSVADAGASAYARSHISHQLDQK